MEVVDVGSSPADDVLELLFEGDALKSLLRGHGAACFALVRPMTAPDFFRKLIENSATLDATTRRHVAFVVFYGDRSGVVRREEKIVYGQGPYRPKVRFDGLSISGDPEFLSDVMVRPATPRREREPVRGRNALFSEELGGMMRNSPENVKESLLEHHMSRVATRLMQIYDIRESSLPCLLFTDGNNLKKHLVVQLNPGEPLKSLYTNVLKPLSDQFAALSKYWALRENIPWWEGLASEATDAVLLLPVEIAKINAEIERQHQAVPEEIREAQEKLDALTEAQQKRLAARSLLTAAKAETVQKMKEELAAINRGDRQFRSLAQRTMETAMLEKRLLREQQSLAAYTNDVLDDETYSMRSQRREIEQLCDLIPDLERKRNRLLTDLTIQNKRIEDYSPDKLKKEKAAVQQMAESLEAAGYGPEILRADRASAFAAIEVMFRNGLLGFNVPNARSLGAHPMRILFLAANPTTTSHIDLEEELRSLESELRGVKYRDQVILTARHAVRPDDLVRFVRSERPTVVHFGGHGSGRGIILRNDEGGYTEVTGASLRRFFLNRGVRLVVLNACYSQEQAKLLSDSVSAVVGTTEVLKDRAAHRFTTAFYRALGEGYSIREAFRDGGDAVILDNREDVFWSNGELDQLLVTPNSN